MGMPHYPFGGAADSGKRIVLARAQGIAGLTQDGVPAGHFNAIWVEVYLASASGSAIVSVEGSGSEGGNYLQIADPNAFPTTRTGSVAFEVSLGCPWAKVRLASVSGTWMVVATPFNSGGSSRARPNYYDRNPVSKTLVYAGTLAPHNPTTRATYTVPTDKKAYGESIRLRLFRVTVATAPESMQFPTMSVDYLPGGVEDDTTTIAQAIIFANTVYDSESIHVPALMHMAPGDIIRLRTSDNDPDGTVRYSGSWKGTEYDA